jgi:hypothetical protein
VASSSGIREKREEAGDLIHEGVNTHLRGRGRVGGSNRGEGSRFFAVDEGGVWLVVLEQLDKINNRIA